MPSETSTLILFTSRGKSFTAEDINLIKEISGNFYDRGRTFISEEVCKKLNWKQPNGWLKDRACREVLRDLDDKKIIKLPPSKIKITPKTVIFDTNIETTKPIIENLMDDEIIKISFKNCAMLNLEMEKRR